MDPITVTEQPVHGSHAAKNIDDSIQELKDRIEELEAKKALEGADPITRSEAGQLAIILHSKQCKFNHTDGCGWFYSVKKNQHDWREYSHQEYLKKAEKALKIVPFETAKKLAKVL